MFVIQRTNIIVLVLLLVPIWIVIYNYLGEISDFMAFRLFQMKPETHWAESIRFFIYEVPKVLMLLVLIIFLAGGLR